MSSVIQPAGEAVSKCHPAFSAPRSVPHADALIPSSTAAAKQLLVERAPDSNWRQDQRHELERPVELRMSNLVQGQLHRSIGVEPASPPYELALQNAGEPL